MKLTSCPYCTSLLKFNNCENKTHKFYGSSNKDYWFLHDKKLMLQIGKSFTHPYYYMLFNKNGSVNIHLMNYVSIENCGAALNQINNLISFI